MTRFLLDQFNILADAPGGVQRLRELILQLAVTGRLEASIQPSNNTEYSNSWKFVHLESIIDLISGQHISQSDYNSQGRGIPYITGPSDFGEKHPIITKYTEFPKVTSKKCDILVTVKGSGLGKINLVNIPELAISRQLMAIRPKGVTIEFLYLFLKTKFDYLQSIATGIAIPGIGRKDILNLEILLLPLDVQKRIVEKVDSLMALCDDLEAKKTQKHAHLVKLGTGSLTALQQSTTQEELVRWWGYLQTHFGLIFDCVENVEALRQTILELAVRGMLGTGDERDEPAILLIGRIQSEKETLLSIRKVKPKAISEILQIISLKYSIPENWYWYRFGDVVFFQEGPGIRNWQFRKEGVKLLNVGNFVNGKLILTNTDKYISEEELNEKYQHFRIEEGDLLFASSGGSWGKTAWFVDPGYPVILNTSTIRLKFYSKTFDPGYLKIFLQSGYFRKQMELQLVGMQPNFGSTHLSRIYIPIPPIPEQSRIVEKINNLMALCDQLEQEIEHRSKNGVSLSNATIQQITGMT